MTVAEIVLGTDSYDGYTMYSPPPEVISCKGYITIVYLAYYDAPVVLDEMLANVRVLGVFVAIVRAVVEGFVL